MVTLHVEQQTGEYLSWEPRQKYKAMYFVVYEQSRQYFIRNHVSKDD